MSSTFPEIVSGDVLAKSGEWFFPIHNAGLSQVFTKVIDYYPDRDPFFGIT